MSLNFTVLEFTKIIKKSHYNYINFMKFVGGLFNLLWYDKPPRKDFNLFSFQKFFRSRQLCKLQNNLNSPFFV